LHQKATRLPPARANYWSLAQKPFWSVAGMNRAITSSPTYIAKLDMNAAGHNRVYPESFTAPAAR